MNNSDWLDSLERAVQEVEALQAIFDDDENGANDDGVSSSIRLALISDSELQQARDLLESGSLQQSEENPAQQIPTLELELFVQHSSDEQDDNDKLFSAQIYFGLTPGYPSFEPVKVAVLTTKGLASRDARERLAGHLQSKAQTLVGSEAILEVTQECQEQLWQLHREAIDASQQQQDADEDDNNNKDQQLKRIYVWVHHITDKQRKDDIVREAQEHALGGYLKAGYPGVVIAEGLQRDCEEFVIWIKGNKSRPGGFGRQWGHHVRGELVISHRQLPETFVALEEDMSVLASHCRDRGLEDEFLRFVMQHG